ncbi:hypothetical protein ACHAXR_011260 [Thalassiosira sp. AJA248-18]
MVKPPTAVLPLILLQILASCYAASAFVLPSKQLSSPPPAKLASSTASIESSAITNDNDEDCILFRQAAQVGIVTAAMGHMYGAILDRTVNGLWTDIPNLLLKRGVKVGPSYIAYTCTAGGLIMGLLSTKLKPAFVVAEYVSTLSGSESDARSFPNLLPALPNLLILSLVTSTLGFSVGPEAPMVCAGGLVGLAMARRWYRQDDSKSYTDDAGKRTAEILTYAGSAGALTSFMGIPLAGPIFALELTRASSGMSSVAKDALGPAVAASASALLLIRGVLAPKSSIGGHFTYQLVNDLSGRAAIVTSIVAGVGGAILGTIFHKLVHLLKDILWKEQNNTSAKSKNISIIYNREVLAKTIIGVAVGLLSMSFPQTMFWGEGSLQCVVDGHMTPFSATKHGLSTMLTGAAAVNPSIPFQSAWAAAQVGCAKLIAIALACAGKFPGGIIFPLFFAAAPIAHAVVNSLSSYLPGAVAPVAVMSLMASTQASVTRTPLATVLMLALSSSSATEISKMLPSVIVSSYVGVWFSRFLSKESYFAYQE